MPLLRVLGGKYAYIVYIHVDRFIIDVYHINDGVAYKLQIIIKYTILFCCKFHMANQVLLNNLLILV